MIVMCNIKVYTINTRMKKTKNNNSLLVHCNEKIIINKQIFR